MDFNDVLGYIISFVGGGGLIQLVNWKLNKKKAGVEVQQSEIEVIAATVRSVYEPIIEQQNKRIAQLDEEVQKLRKEKVEMQESYEKRIQSLQLQILGITRSLGIRAHNQVRDAGGRFTKNKKDGTYDK